MKHRFDEYSFEFVPPLDSENLDAVNAVAEHISSKTLPTVEAEQFILRQIGVTRRFGDDPELLCDMFAEITRRDVYVTGSLDNE